MPNGELSAEFLSQLFGWDFQRFSDHYWLYELPDGVAVGLLQKSDCQTLKNVCPVFVDVPDVERCLQHAAEMGAEIIEAKMEIEGYGAWAKIKEPGGNTVGLFERD